MAVQGSITGGGGAAPGKFEEISTRYDPRPFARAGGPLSKNRLGMVRSCGTLADDPDFYTHGVPCAYLWDDGLEDDDPAEMDDEPEDDDPAEMDDAPEDDDPAGGNVTDDPHDARDEDGL